MPTPPRSQSLVTGAAGSFLAQSREREANHSESSTAERRSERATPKGVRVGSNAGSQPDDEVSDQFGFLSEAGLFVSAAKQSWSVSRLCRCPGRHAEHRAHIAVALAGRSLAAIGVFGSDRAVLGCLDSLLPAERMQRELASSLADAEWSAAAAKLASQCRSPASRSFAGGIVRMLGAKHGCKYTLCDAGFWHAHAASLGVILLCPGRGEASRPWKGNCATCRRTPQPRSEATRSSIIVPR